MTDQSPLQARIVVESQKIGTDDRMTQLCVDELNDMLNDPQYARSFTRAIKNLSWINTIGLGLSLVGFVCFSVKTIGLLFATSSLESFTVPLMMFTGGRLISFAANSSRELKQKLLDSLKHLTTDPL